MDEKKERKTLLGPRAVKKSEELHVFCMHVCTCTMYAPATCGDQQGAGSLGTGVTDCIDCLECQMALGDESCVLSARAASAAEAAENVDDVVPLNTQEAGQVMVQGMKI